MNKFSELEAFVTVVNTGTFSAAAERLQLTKSAVSRRVSELEERLGAQLLNRTTRRISLTESGASFHEQAERILSDLDEVEQTLSREQEMLQGRIRFAAPLSFGLKHLTPVLSEFLREHPGIELDLDLNDRQINLLEEGFDMALRIGHLEDSSLIARRVGKIRFATCASPDYLLEHGTPAHPDELNNHLGLEYSNLPRHLRWQYKNPQGKVAHPKPTTRLYANNGEVLLAASIAGFGVVCLPTFLASEAILNQQLTPILSNWTSQDEGMYVVYPPGRYHPKRLKLLTDVLQKRFGESPYWDDCLT